MSTHPHHAPGILFAEDFDDAPPPPTPEMAAEPEIITPSFTADEMADARREGFAAGQAAAREEAAQRLQEAARRSCERLGELLVRTEAMREAQLAEAAEAAAKLVFAALSAALPSLTTRHAASEILYLLRHTLAALAPDQALAITVAPETVEPLRAALAALPRDQARRVALSGDDSLAAGDARLTWHGGTATSQPQLAQHALADILTSLDLLPATLPSLTPRLTPPAAAAVLAPHFVENINA